jgi:glycosyltransferase involved in cell wall biosynthesis
MGKLRVLHISSGDLIGSRFNGYDWHDKLNQENIDSKMLVGWNTTSGMIWTQGFMNPRGASKLRIRNRTIFHRFLAAGLENGSYPWSNSIFSHPWYLAADVIHLQIVHDGTLDMKSIARIISEKPVVWTWHDPWPLTGHCIYPMDCWRWKLGCGECPDLERAFTIKRDRTALMRIEKAKLVNREYVLHVSTNWFANLISSDSSTNTPVPNVIPFGIDGLWEKVADPSKIRDKLGIPTGNFVIGLRAAFEPQKNLEMVSKALRVIPKDTPLTIVTLQDLGALAEFKDIFQIIEFPWTDDKNEMVNFYSILDLFLMPSTYETFGLMALEAMSCGVPVAGLRGTAVEEVCQLSKNGFVIDENTGLSLANVIFEAFLDQYSLSIKSRDSEIFVKSKYSLDDFIPKLVSLYMKAIREKNR